MNEETKTKLISYGTGLMVIVFLVFANGKYQKAVGYSEGLEAGQSLYAVDREIIVQSLTDKYEAQRKIQEYEIKELEKGRLSELVDNTKLTELEKLRAINDLFRQP